MKKDIVKESANFVRGNLEDSLYALVKQEVECRRCGNQVSTKSSCYSVCPNCKEINRSCGD